MWKTDRKNEIFLAAGGRSNSYLIPTSDGNILIDTGVKSDYSGLRKNIASLHLVAPKIDYLILTHSHFDHCRNVQRLVEEDGCQVIMSEREAGFASKGYTTIPKGTLGFTKFLSKVGTSIGASHFGYPAFKADVLVSERHVLMDDDIKVELISTEGHSTGSISIIIDNDIALVGDAVIGVIKNWLFPPFADNEKMVIQSWKKLLDTNCHLFLPGHGTPIHRDVLEKSYHKYSEKHAAEAIH